MPQNASFGRQPSASTRHRENRLISPIKLDIIVCEVCARGHALAREYVRPYLLVRLPACLPCLPCVKSIGTFSNVRCERRVVRQLRRRREVRRVVLVAWHSLRDPATRHTHSLGHEERRRRAYTVVAYIAMAYRLRHSLGHEERRWCACI